MDYGGVPYEIHSLFWAGFCSDLKCDSSHPELGYLLSQASILLRPNRRRLTENNFWMPMMIFCSHNLNLKFISPVSPISFPFLVSSLGFLVTAKFYTMFVFMYHILKYLKLWYNGWAIFLYFNLLKFQKPPIFRWNWASLTFQSIYALDADHLLIILNRLLSLSHEQTASNFIIISILKS